MDLKHKQQPSKVYTHTYTHTPQSTNERAWMDIYVAWMQAHCSGAFSVLLTQGKNTQSNQIKEIKDKRERMADVNTQHIQPPKKTTMAISVPSFGNFFNKYNLKKKKKKKLNTQASFANQNHKKESIKCCKNFHRTDLGQVTTGFWSLRSTQVLLGTPFCTGLSYEPSLKCIVCSTKKGRWQKERTLNNRTSFSDASRSLVVWPRDCVFVSAWKSTPSAGGNWCHRHHRADTSCWMQLLCYLPPSQNATVGRTVFSQGCGGHSSR